MNLYEVGFEGEALGGTAIVEAENESDAIRKLEEAHPETEPFRHTGEYYIEKIEKKNGVLYYWNGDY